MLPAEEANGSSVLCKMATVLGLHSLHIAAEVEGQLEADITEIVDWSKNKRKGQTWRRVRSAD